MVSWGVLKGSGPESSLALLVRSGHPVASSDGSRSAVAADPGRHMLVRFESEWDDQTGECSNVRATRLFPSEAPRIAGLGRVMEKLAHILTN